MTTQVLFKNRHPNRIASLEEYRASGGYEALSMSMEKHFRSRVQQLALDAVLLGRGGAPAAPPPAPQSGPAKSVARCVLTTQSSATLASQRSRNLT